MVRAERVVTKTTRRRAGPGVVDQIALAESFSGTQPPAPGGSHGDDDGDDERTTGTSKQVLQWRPLESTGESTGEAKNAASCVQNGQKEKEPLGSFPEALEIPRSGQDEAGEAPIAEASTSS